LHRHFQFRLILVRPTLHILGPICSEVLYLSLLSRTFSERPVSSPSQHYTPGPSSPSAIYHLHCYPGVSHHSLCPALALLPTHTPYPLHLLRSGLPRLSSLCPATTITPFALLTCSASTTANLVAFLPLARVCALHSI
jgi:hypothetical protein